MFTRVNVRLASRGGCPQRFWFETDETSCAWLICSRGAATAYETSLDGMEFVAYPSFCGGKKGLMNGIVVFFSYS